MPEDGIYSHVLWSGRMLKLQHYTFWTLILSMYLCQRLVLSVMMSNLNPKLTYICFAFCCWISISGRGTFLLDFLDNCTLSMLPLLCERGRIQCEWALPKTITWDIECFVSNAFQQQTKTTAYTHIRENPHPKHKVLCDHIDKILRTKYWSRFHFSKLWETKQWRENTTH